MMGWSLADAERATWWQYQAVLWNHNDRHTRPEDEEVEAPDAGFVARRMAKLDRAGISRSLH